MKLKYYLRGLGIGIIVTAIILMITNAGSTKPLTDEQIIERAKELGMILPEEDSEEDDPEANGDSGAVGVFNPEENQTAGDTKKPEETPMPDNDTKADPLDSSSGEDTQGAGDTSQNEEEPDNPDASDGSKEPDTTTPSGAENGPEDAEGEEDANGAEDASSTPQEPEMVTIEISQGEYSDSVSRKLMEAGLISDAVDFNAYLVKQGMDNLLAVGTHQIPQGANYAEIAAALCRK